MSKVLSKEAVGQLVLRGAAALALAGVVKGFIHLQGTKRPVPENGGWEELDFTSDRPNVFEEASHASESAKQENFETQA